MQCSRSILDGIKDDFVYNLFTYFVRDSGFFPVVAVVQWISRSMKVLSILNFSCVHKEHTLIGIISFIFFSHAMNRHMFDTEWDEILVVICIFAYVWWIFTKLFFLLLAFSLQNQHIQEQQHHVQQNHQQNNQNNQHIHVQPAPVTKSRGKHADGKPRGRMTAYAFFVQTCREEHKKKHPEEQVVFAEFSRKCAERWKVSAADPLFYSVFVLVVWNK